MWNGCSHLNQWKDWKRDSGTDARTHELHSENVADRGGTDGACAHYNIVGCFWLCQICKTFLCVLSTCFFASSYWQCVISEGLFGYQHVHGYSTFVPYLLVSMTRRRFRIFRCCFVSFVISFGHFLSGDYFLHLFPSISTSLARYHFVTFSGNCIGVTNSTG